jgi:hypothetical protein
MEQRHDTTGGLPSNGETSRPAIRSRALEFHDHVLLFHDYRDGFRDVRTLNHTLSLSDLHGITADGDLRRIAIALAGTDIELPPMPRAAEYFAFAGVAIFARLVRFDEAGQDPVAQRAALVWTAIEQAKEFAAQVENGDLAPANGDKFPLTRWDLANRGHDMFAHNQDVPV